MEGRMVVVGSLLLVIVMGSFFGSGQGTITCGIVSKSLTPCINYLKTGAPMPSANGCCNGVRSLNMMAKTVVERQNACKCIKSMINIVKPKPELVSTLPGKCDVILGYAISVNTNCATVR